MPTVKYYMIVTNDANETPVAVDLRGAKQVAEYLGVSVNRVRKNLCTGVWNHKAKYKAVVTGVVMVDKRQQEKLARIRREMRKGA